MIETDGGISADSICELPEGWRWARLVDLGRFESGGTPAKDVEEYWGGSVPFVTGADITAFFVSASHARATLTEAGLRSGKTAVCDPGTILFVTRTRVGRVGIATETMGASQDLSPYICGSTLMPEYVCWYLRSISDSLVANSRGATIQGLTRDFAESIRIPVPPLPEQRRIAAILREQLAAVEQARAAAEAQLAAARALFAAYLREVFESDEAREWPVCRISEIAATCSGSTPSRMQSDYYGGSILWVKTGELTDGVIYDTEEHLTDRAMRETSIRLLPRGTLLIAMYGQGQTRGRTGLLACPATTNQACFAILPNQDRFDGMFLQYWFRRNYARIRSASDGRGGNQPNLNGDILRSQRVALPSVTDQRRIARDLEMRMEAVEQVMDLFETQLDAIKQLPAALLRRAFNGEL